MTLKIQQLLARHEGLRLTLYKDTLGIETIGYGRNLRDRGISPKEAEYLLNQDIIEISAELSQRWPHYKDLDLVRKAAILDMGFMGVRKLMGFKNMLKALEEHNWGIAAREAMDSKWAEQVGQRSNDIAEMFLTGKWPEWVKDAE